MKKLKADEKPNRGGPARKGQPRPDAREALLNAAEELLGQRGFAGVSLREIGAAAGQRNNSAVSYHFQDKIGLVDALLADRVGKAERLRQERIDKISDLSTLSAGELLRLLWQPLHDIDDEGSRHGFVRFLLTYQLNPSFGYPSDADPDNYPASVKILEALRNKCPHLTAEQFRYRLALLAMMTWAATSWHDNVVNYANMRRTKKFSLEEPIRMAVAALLMPE